MHYYINPAKGIYYTEKAYHVDYIYVVDFEKPDVDKQFQCFLDQKEKDGEHKGMQKLKGQFRELRNLLS